MTRWRSVAFIYSIAAIAVILVSGFADTGVAYAKDAADVQCESSGSYQCKWQNNGQATDASGKQCLQSKPCTEVLDGCPTTGVCTSEGVCDAKSVCGQAPALPSVPVQSSGSFPPPTSASVTGGADYSQSSSNTSAPSQLPILPSPVNPDDYTQPATQQSPSLGVSPLQQAANLSTGNYSSPFSELSPIPVSKVTSLTPASLPSSYMISALSPYSSTNLSGSPVTEGSLNPTQFSQLSQQSASQALNAASTFAPSGDATYMTLPNGTQGIFVPSSGSLSLANTEALAGTSNPVVINVNNGVVILNGDNYGLQNGPVVVNGTGVPDCRIQGCGLNGAMVDLGLVPAPQDPVEKIANTLETGSNADIFQAVNPATGSTLGNDVAQTLQDSAKNTGFIPQLAAEFSLSGPALQVTTAQGTEYQQLSFSDVPPPPVEQPVVLPTIEVTPDDPSLTPPTSPTPPTAEPVVEPPVTTVTEAEAEAAGSMPPSTQSTRSVTAETSEPYPTIPVQSSQLPPPNPLPAPDMAAPVAPVPPTLPAEVPEAAPPPAAEGETPLSEVPPSASLAAPVETPPPAPTVPTEQAPPAAAPAQQLATPPPAPPPDQSASLGPQPGTPSTAAPPAETTQPINPLAVDICSSPAPACSSPSIAVCTFNAWSCSVPASIAEFAPPTAASTLVAPAPPTAEEQALSLPEVSPPAQVAPTEQAPPPAAGVAQDDQPPPANTSPSAQIPPPATSQEAGDESAGLNTSAPAPAATPSPNAAPAVPIAAAPSNPFASLAAPPGSLPPAAPAAPPAPSIDPLVADACASAAPVCAATAQATCAFGQWSCVIPTTIAQALPSASAPPAAISGSSPVIAVPSSPAPAPAQNPTPSPSPASNPSPVATPTSVPAPAPAAQPSTSLSQQVLSGLGTIATYLNPISPAEAAPAPVPNVETAINAAQSSIQSAGAKASAAYDAGDYAGAIQNGIAALQAAKGLAAAATNIPDPTGNLQASAKSITARADQYIGTLQTALGNYQTTKSLTSLIGLTGMKTQTDQLAADTAQLATDAKAAAAKATAAIAAAPKPAAATPPVPTPQAHAPEKAPAPAAKPVVPAAAPTNPALFNSAPAQAAVASSAYQRVTAQGISGGDILVTSPNYANAWRTTIQTTMQELAAQGILNPQLDVSAVLAIARREQGVPGGIAVSSTGVAGPMQVTSGTAFQTLGGAGFITQQGIVNASTFATKDLLGSVITGTILMNQLLNANGGNIATAAQIYNSGSPTSCIGGDCNYGIKAASDVGVMRNAITAGNGNTAATAAQLNGLYNDRTTSPTALSQIASILTGSAAGHPLLQKSDVTMVGDSIAQGTSGCASAVNTACSGTMFKGSAVSGASTAAMVNQINALPSGSKIAVIAGTNDFNRTPAQVQADVKAVIAAAAARNIQIVAWAGASKDMTPGNATQDQQFNAVNNAIKSALPSSIPFVDLRSPSLDAYRSGYHYTAAGYMAIGDMIMAAANAGATGVPLAPPGGWKGSAATPTIAPGNAGYAPGINRVAAAPASGFSYYDPETGARGVPTDPNMSQAAFTQAAREDIAMERLAQQGTLPQGAQFQNFIATLDTSKSASEGASTYTITGTDESGATVTYASNVSLPAGAVDSNGNVRLLSDSNGLPLSSDGTMLSSGATPLSISSDATLPKPAPDPTTPNQLDFPDDRPAQPAQPPAAPAVPQNGGQPRGNNFSNIYGTNGLGANQSNNLMQNLGQLLGRLFGQPSAQQQQAPSTPQASVTLTAGSYSLASGATTSLSWSGYLTTSCDLFQQGGALLFAGGSSGSTSTPAASSTASYVVQCQGSSGGTVDDGVTITVNQSP